jgi:hydrogenase maturation protease
MLNVTKDSHLQKTATLIVGLGSPHGDDQAGWLAVDQLRRQEPRCDAEIRHAAVPLDVLDWLDGVQELHLIDACASTAGECDIFRLKWTNGRLHVTLPSGNNESVCSAAAGKNAGTHGIGMIEVLQLADAMGQLPEEVVVWAIPMHSSAPEARISEDAQKRVRKAVTALHSELVQRTVAASSGFPNGHRTPAEAVKK